MTEIEGESRRQNAMASRHCDASTFFDGLTRPCMRVLVSVYLVAGAPHGATAAGLLQYWRESSASWRSVPVGKQRRSIEAALRHRFFSEDLCSMDGTLRQPAGTSSAASCKRTVTAV